MSMSSVILTAILVCKALHARSVLTQVAHVYCVIVVLWGTALYFVLTYRSRQSLT